MQRRTRRPLDLPATADGKDTTMGIVYVGPYADDVHAEADHEGYAARLWPDGRITGSWGGEHGWTGHIGLVGACDCGWCSDRIRLSGDLNSPEYEAAERDFEVEHLDPLIKAAKNRSWPDWARRTADRANYIATLVEQDRRGEAREALDRLRDDVNRRLLILGDLRRSREVAEHVDPQPTPAHATGRFLSLRLDGAAPPSAAPDLGNDPPAGRRR
jgi:hypothetical protein